MRLVRPLRTVGLLVVGHGWVRRRVRVRVRVTELGSFIFERLILPWVDESRMGIE